MATSLCLSSSSPPLRPSLFNLRHPNASKSSSAPNTLPITSAALSYCRRPHPPLLQSPPPRETPRKLRRRCSVSAAAQDALPSPTEAQQIVSSGGDDGVSTVISALLFTAFIGLSVLTIGVIYIAVTDFLQKREREKFEKEETAKKKGGKKKVRARARAGPKGFGQKTGDEYEVDD